MPSDNCPHLRGIDADCRLNLDRVTLVAASSVALDLTLRSLRRCMAQARFADVMLFTDASLHSAPDDPIHIIPIDRLSNQGDYSRFIVKSLPDYIDTEFALCVQWDGFITNASAWTDDFLTVDYVGAPWPQFSDGYDVGNGGFSLRSRRLLKACQDRRIVAEGPEDLVICHNYRALLCEEHGIKIADRALASRFAYERTKPTGYEFGFHGVFNMARHLGSRRLIEVLSSTEPGLIGERDCHQIARQALWKWDLPVALSAVQCARKGKRKGVSNGR